MYKHFITYFSKRYSLACDLTQPRIFSKNQQLIPHFYLFQELTGENNIEKLARYFTKQEEENFALFNYVNELSYEVEILNESVQRLQDEIGKIDKINNFYKNAIKEYKNNGSEHLSLHQRHSHCYSCMHEE